MANHLTLFADTTSSSEIINGQSRAIFQNIQITRNGGNQTLMSLCHDGYLIQCAPPQPAPATAETSIYVAIIVLVLVFIGLIIMFFAKKLRDKGNTIKDLQRQLSQRSEKYGTLENDA